jgi:hypothetical protein
MDEMNGA